MIDKDVKNKEKREAVTSALKNHPELTNSAIAFNLDVSRAYVGKVRKNLIAQEELENVTLRQNKAGQWFDVSSLEQLSLFSPPPVTPKPDILELLKDKIARLPTEEIAPFSSQIEELIKAELHSRRDNSLENAIIALARNCDGASSEDAMGFNKFDAHYGHWLAEQITAGHQLVRPIAKKAHSMVKKYHRQVTVSPWSNIAHQYPEPTLTFEKDEKAIKLAGDKIAVLFPYDPDLVRIVKTITPWGKFNFKGQDKNWYFPEEACLSLVETFSPHKFYIDPNLEGLIASQQAEKLEKQAEELKKQQEAEQEAQKRAKELLHFIDGINLDQPLDNGWTLFEHQKEGIKWLLSRQKKGILRGGILADHMGLGKTIQTLVAGKYLSEHHSNCPIFVICPASLRDNWAKEAELIGIKIETFSWAKVPQPLQDKPYILIADESHYAQNPTSKRSKALLALADHENCVANWLLTGTPLKNGRPINLYPLLLACDHPLSWDKKAFELRYCNGRRGAWGWDNSGASHLDELAKKTEDVILRRTKKQCLDLPSKIRSKKQCLLTGKTKKQYQQEIDNYIADYQQRVVKGEVSD